MFVAVGPVAVGRPRRRPAGCGDGGRVGLWGQGALGHARGVARAEGVELWAGSRSAAAAAVGLVSRRGDGVVMELDHTRHPGPGQHPSLHLIVVGGLRDELLAMVLVSFSTMHEKVRVSRHDT